MHAEVVLRSSWEKARRSLAPWLVPLTVALAYYAAAQAAFLIGTLSDRIFAPFWPPNAVLFCALVLSPRGRWGAILTATFPAHALAELQVGMPVAQLSVAFATNCTVAILNALALAWLAGGPPWFGTVRKAAIYIVATAGVNPAIAAIGGAFVPIMGGGSIADYLFYWSNWYVGNALASLTLGPIILTWMDRVPENHRLLPMRRQAEAVLFVTALLVAYAASFKLSVELAGSAFVPAILYLPLPIILWGSVRFGEKGASGAILILTAVSIWLTLNGPSPFAAESPEKSVLALQLFLVGVAVPVLLLSAAIDELRYAERTTRKLAGSLLRAQDEERRRIAQDLHDSTAQKLVAASLIARSIADAASNSQRPAWSNIEDMLEQSIQELRLSAYLLHPPILEESGLREALERYVEGYSERSGIAVSVAIAPDIGRLSRDRELALYRVVQEALTNVDRHSGSLTACIQLTRRRASAGDVVVLTVKDVGRGISTMGIRADYPGHQPGVGLVSMRERVRQIGGRLTITSTPGKTMVSVVVPVAD